MKMQTIAGAETGPHLLIIAGVHGDEPEGVEAVHALPDRIDPAGLTGRLTLIPVVNEAAVAARQRCGPDDLDLARTCPGDPAGSITERVAHAVSERIREADFLVDLHSGGEIMRVAPLAGYTLHPDADILEAQRRMARAMNLPTVWGTNPGLDGRTLSVARDAGVPAIYSEWLGGGACDADGVRAYIDGCMNVMRELGMLPGPSVVDRVERIVEDPRDQSGYLQIQHPSPMTGTFTAAVTLGQEVRCGDVLGTVANGDREETVAAMHPGMVIGLRCRQDVQRDDGLAVILEEFLE